MKTDFSFLCAFLILALSNLSFQWPVENARLTSTYGESRADHFHDGIDLISNSSDAVYPLEQGRLVYLWDKALFPEDNYPGGGNYKIIAHRGGFSVYMHLQDGLSLKRDLPPKEALGYIGNTGHSFAKHLHVSIMDPRTRSSKNLLPYLPPYADLKSPEIGEMCLKIEDKYVIIRDRSTIRLTSHYPLLVKIFDSATGGEKLGIYSIRANFNGKQALSADFDGLVSSGKNILASGRTFESLYDPEGYYKIDGLTYRQGPNDLEIIAADFAGNKTVKSFQFNVNLDMDKAGR